MAKKPVVKKPAANPTKKTLFDELSTATGVTPDGEAYQDYAVRLGEAVSKIDDATYGKLSVPAQKWFTDATDAINAERDAPVLPGYPESSTGDEKDAAAEPPKEAVPSSVVEKEKTAKPKKQFRSGVKSKEKAAMKKAAKAKAAPKAAKVDAATVAMFVKAGLTGDKLATAIAAVS